MAKTVAYRLVAGHSSLYVHACQPAEQVHATSPTQAQVLAHITEQSTTGAQAMGAMNKQMNMPALMNIMREFERQNEKMEMTSDMMGDAIDDAFEASGTLVQLHCIMFQISHHLDRVATKLARSGPSRAPARTHRARHGPARSARASHTTMVSSIT